MQCAKAGADVVLAARTESRLATVADEIKQLGRRTLQVGTDINDEESAQHLVDATLAEFGRVDALVNNAFAIPPLGRLVRPSTSSRCGPASRRTCSAPCA